MKINKVAILSIVVMALVTIGLSAFIWNTLGSNTYSVSGYFESWKELRGIDADNVNSSFNAGYVFTIKNALYEQQKGSVITRAFVTQEQFFFTDVKYSPSYIDSFVGKQIMIRFHAANNGIVIDSMG